MQSEMIVVTPKLLLAVEKTEQSESASIALGGRSSCTSPSARLTIFGKPRTKKTHSQISLVRGRPFLFPSKHWSKWVKDATIEIDVVPLLLIAHPVNCRAIFYRDRNAGDAVGFYQGLADFLEMCLVCRKKKCYCNDTIKILQNDKWITQWDGTRLAKDPSNPRTEICLTPL